MTEAAQNLLPADGNLRITLATYIYLLYDAGRSTADATINGICAQIREVPAGQSADALGQQLVEVISGMLPEGRVDFPAVLALAEKLYGPHHVRADLGTTTSTREERLSAIRRYQFSTNLPWIAHVIDRFPDGTVGGHWILVERVTDEVTAMDPYPWDDVDEERHLPLADFLVKWELQGCQSIRHV